MLAHSGSEDSGIAGENGLLLKTKRHRILLLMSFPILVTSLVVFTMLVTTAIHGDPTEASVTNALTQVALPEAPIEMTENPMSICYMLYLVSLALTISSIAMRRSRFGLLMVYLHLLLPLVVIMAFVFWDVWRTTPAKGPADAIEEPSAPSSSFRGLPCLFSPNLPPSPCWPREA